MNFQRDFSTPQFTRLKDLHQEAVSCLESLTEKYPEHKKIWDIAKKKMEIIEASIEADELPTDDRKRDADMSTMLTHELLDYFGSSNELDPLYKLDKAYTLLGMKNIRFE